MTRFLGCLCASAAPVLDSLNSPAECRRVRVNYLSLVTPHMNPPNQLSLAVGREVIR
jgi:hypothetical protein